MIPHVPPPSFPVGRLRGAYARGAAYERKVGRWLAGHATALGWTFFDHPWLLDGTRYCQPDFILVSPSGCLLVVESKLTWVDCSTQVAKYRRALASFTVTHLLIVRRVVPGAPPIIPSFEDAVDGGVLLWID